MKGMEKGDGLFGLVVEGVLAEVPASDSVMTLDPAKTKVFSYQAD